MDKLKLLRPEAYTYLMDEDNLPRELWTNYAFPIRSWKSYTNNLAERAMAWLGEDLRTKAPVALIKHYLSLIVSQRLARKKEASKRIMEVPTTNYSPQIQLMHAYLLLILNRDTKYLHMLITYISRIYSSLTCCMCSLMEKTHSMLQSVPLRTTHLLASKTRLVLWIGRQLHAHATLKKRFHARI